MCNEDIQVTPIVNAVEKQVGNHPERPEVGVRLGVLIRPVGAVLDASAKAADQKRFKAHQLQIQV